MEVHAHSHTQRKKWTHYFWEFLMLFLAVFCGFLAENQREHMVEENRVKAQMHDMIQNLSYDTMRISITKPTYSRDILKTDSIRTAIKELAEGKKDPSGLYYFLINSLENGLFFYSNPVFNNTAFSQLKSSGLMRLVKPDTLNFFINDYYNRQYANLASGFENLEKRMNIIAEACISFIDLTPFHDQFSRYQGLDKKLSPYSPMDTIIANLLNDIKEQKYSLSLLNNNKAALVRLYNNFTAFENSYKNLVDRMDFFKNAAVLLMQRIKETYHIK